MYIRYVRGIVIDGGIPGDANPSWPVYVYTGTHDYLSLGGPGGVGLPTRPRSVTNRPAMTRPPAAVRNRDAEKRKRLRVQQIHIHIYIYLYIYQTGTHGLKGGDIEAGIRDRERSARIIV